MIIVPKSNAVWLLFTHEPKRQQAYISQEGLYVHSCVETIAAYLLHNTSNKVKPVGSLVKISISIIIILVTH